MKTFFTHMKLNLATIQLRKANKRMPSKYFETFAYLCVIHFGEAQLDKLVTHASLSGRR